ncbi:acetyl-CoA carboxylase carboxyl transferase subunit alpha [Fodinicola acaciae]|uniref:acetyl-CoA carboxylase carboxyl transferase subunit alpha n=1 Tax=Fodinicola acaciae TaxID=2681555 RepID=UPI0013D4C68D|nr:acetyl-CoA carboxylase carboxyl transferase subunit alpha [Fodinicola acaciae]
MTATVPAPAAEWVRCPGCHDIVYGPRLARSLQVCPGCGRHGRLTAPERIEQLLDPGWTAIEVPEVSADALHFVDSVPYPQRLAAARRQTGLREAVLCVRGTVDGRRVVAAVMDFRFLGGSLGAGVGERITIAAETAVRERTPFLLATASGGARMQEGALALMQMVKTSQAMAMLDEAGILTVGIVTDPTYGGVAASYATLPDVILAEPAARVGFAGPRVIAQTTGRTLPEGFQTAEFLLAQGLVDAVVPRPALRRAIARLLSAHDPKPRPAAADHSVRIVRRAEDLPERDGLAAVRLARHADRPTTEEYATFMLEEFMELRGDRVSGDCAAIVGGVGLLDGRPVVLVGHQKGRDTRERVQRNFGMPSPSGYRKAGRLMRLAAKLGLPVVTLIDTPGADPGIEAEQRGQAWAIAENLRLMSGLPVPVVAVVTGEGGSGGALALGVANTVLALSNAVYSVISPEGCAAILWKDPDIPREEAVAKAADALRLHARELLAYGIVDGVIGEPGEGAHTDPVLTMSLVRTAVAAAVRELARVDPAGLVAGRRRRFRSYGRVAEGDGR